MMNEALVKVRDTLETLMGSTTVKSYYAGDVGIPYANSLPAVIVRELYTEMDRPSTAKDRYRFGISALVVMDMRANMTTTADTDEIIQARQVLRKLVEEADTDGAPKTTTLLGALLKKSTLRSDKYEWIINTRVDYRPSVPGDFFYVAAEITFELLEQVTRKA